MAPQPVRHASRCAIFNRISTAVLGAAIVGKGLDGTLLLCVMVDPSEVVRETFFCIQARAHKCFVRTDHGDAPRWTRESRVK